MWAISYLLLVHLVLVRSCYAFDNPNMSQLFRLVGCDNYDLDTVLAQTKLMITNAQSKIDGIVSAGVITPLTGDGRAANNARNMFNTRLDWKQALSSDSKTTLATVRGTSGITNRPLPILLCVLQLPTLAEEVIYRQLRFNSQCTGERCRRYCEQLHYMHRRLTRIYHQYSRPRTNTWTCRSGSG